MPYMQQLIDGYRRFREKDWARERERWSELAEGQSPGVMILSCADSRVDPAQIFDARPGEMFVVRNIAALAPPYETSRGFHGVSAALEFAVTQLEVGEITEMEQEAVKVSLANLRTFPWIAERERDGRLTLHGAYFSIAEGRLYLLDE